MTRQRLFLAIEVLAPLVLIGVWWAASAGSTDPYFPALSKIFDRFGDIWLFSRFESDVLPSLIRMFAGFGIAAAIGIPLGVALGLAPRLHEAVSPVLEFFRAIPPPALIPFGIVVLGVGDAMKIFIIVAVCIFPIMLNAVDGVRGVHPGLIESARAYQVGKRDRLLHVVLPAAMPQMFAGLRTGLSLALILMVISEMVASTSGIGYFVLQSQRTFAITDMWAGILLLGILGYLLNLVFALVERRVLRWHRASRGAALN
jgi:ABC-type nitrate/sulfonate/bicarbonate transport system permease component